MRSDGQEWAIGQLADIAKASGDDCEIVEIKEPWTDDAALEVVISLNCRGFDRKDGGVPLKARERIHLSIPSGFPLSRPEARFAHKRYAGYPHVQWGDYICLYQAPDIEWQASRGMFALMRRILDWLKAAAAGELDPAGMPLHPPVAYALGTFCIIPHENTPTPEPPFWVGYVDITRERDNAAELGGWTSFHDQTPVGRKAAAILLPGPMPHEYPETMLNLLLTLIDRGISVEVMRSLITIGVLDTPPGQRAFFVLGAAMRGTAGGDRLQHLACWRIDAERTDSLRAATLASTPDNPLGVQAFYDWALAANVEWCHVLEDRPEIVERRDSQSPASWWKGKNVVVLGCGAIGGAVAMMLARAGVRQLQLVDNGMIKPGLLVRQNFRADHVGFSKVSATKLYLEGANPNVEVTSACRNVVGLLRDEDEMQKILAADAIIDATASGTVAAALESYFRKRVETRPPLISMSLGHNADRAMMTMSPGDDVGATLDLERRSKLAFSGSPKGRPYLEEFWPSGTARRKPFQPEPGCSSPTFRGSYSDVLSLSARMVNVAAIWLGAGHDQAKVFAMDLSAGDAAHGLPRELDLAWSPYQVLTETQRGYQLRITEAALRGMLSWTRRAERLHRDKTETGGLLFGQVDDFLKVVWVDEVSGPPPDSVASPDLFLCGTSGVKALNEEKLGRTTGSVSFLGMWHTHPQSSPKPSRTDFGAMRMLLEEKGGYQGRRFLMLIVGGTAKAPIVSAGLFDRVDYVQG